MFFKKKEERNDVSLGQAVAIIVGCIALAVAIGAARWSWLTLDEQIQLRNDFMDLKAEQEQLKIQFDFWDQKVSAERAQIRQMRNQMQNVNAPAR